jgi:hypothetical protein
LAGHAQNNDVNHEYLQLTNVRFRRMAQVNSEVKKTSCLVWFGGINAPDDRHDETSNRTTTEKIGTVFLTTQ